MATDPDDFLAFTGRTGTGTGSGAAVDDTTPEAIAAQVFAETEAPTPSQQLAALAQQLSVSGQLPQGSPWAQMSRVGSWLNPDDPASPRPKFASQYEKLQRKLANESPSVRNTILNQFSWSSVGFSDASQADAAVDQLTSDQYLAPYRESDTTAHMLQELVRGTRAPIDQAEEQFRMRQAAAQTALGPLMTTMMARLGGPDTVDGRALNAYAKLMQYRAQQQAPDFVAQRENAMRQILNSEAGMNARAALDSSLGTRRSTRSVEDLARNADTLFKPWDAPELGEGIKIHTDPIRGPLSDMVGGNPNDHSLRPVGEPVERKTRKPGLFNQMWPF